MDSTVTIASLENGVEDAVLHFAAAIMVAFLIRESVLMYCAVRRKVLTAAMNVMSCKTAPKDFMGQTTVMPLPAKLRVCLSKSTEKINL